MPTANSRPASYCGPLFRTTKKGHPKEPPQGFPSHLATCHLVSPYAAVTVPYLLGNHFRKGCAESYKCEECKARKNAAQTKKMACCPQVLVLHMKQYDALGKKVRLWAGLVRNAWHNSKPGVLSFVL